MRVGSYPTRHLATLDFYFFTFKMDQKICLFVFYFFYFFIIFIFLFLFFQLILALIFQLINFGALFWDIPMDFDFFSPVFWI